MGTVTIKMEIAAQFVAGDDQSIAGAFSTPLKFAMRTVTLLTLVVMLTMWVIGLPLLYDATTSPCEPDCSTGQITSADIAERMAHFFQRMGGAAVRETSLSPFPDLTEREHEILDLIARGKSNADIAEQLVITAKTVSNHISNIFNKLQVVDRAQAVIKARDAGMGKDAP